MGLILAEETILQRIRSILLPLEIPFDQNVTIALYKMWPILTKCDQWFKNTYMGNRFPVQNDLKFFHPKRNVCPKLIVAPCKIILKGATSCIFLFCLWYKKWCAEQQQMIKRCPRARKNEWPQKRVEKTATGCNSISFSLEIKIGQIFLLTQRIPRKVWKRMRSLANSFPGCQEEETESLSSMVLTKERITNKGKETLQDTLSKLPNRFWQSMENQSKVKILMPLGENS